MTVRIGHLITARIGIKRYMDVKVHIVHFAPKERSSGDAEGGEWVLGNGEWGMGNGEKIVDGEW
jgi:hypothetical protein